MASASSLLTEEQFQCSICLDVFTDPISTPCGHNYCNACITRHWDNRDVCQCPLCQQSFHTRPQFSVNRVLSEMADQFRKLKQLKESSDASQEPHAEADDVSCDVCTDTKLKALKSCLVCMISYCQTHLEPHQRIAALKRHKLIDPVKNLEDVMCKKHDRPLEMFCQTDRVTVCRFCTESDHKSHQIVSLEEACEAEMGKTEAEVQKRIRERELNIQKVQHSVELSRKHADTEIADSVQVFTALISCIERSQAEVVNVIEKQQKETDKQADGFIKDLQQEITQLEKRSSELKQLSPTEDHLHLLQNFTSINTLPPTKGWLMVSTKGWTGQLTSYAGTVMTAVAELNETLTHEMERNLRDVELRRVQQHAVDVTLDPDTAHRALVLSKNGKQVHDGGTAKMLPENKKRFSRSLCVLGKQSFSSGRFYYEVQVKGKTSWSLGVARESIRRKESFTTTFLRRSPANGYWTIMLTSEYEARADPPVVLSVKKELQKVGVFVDYEEGLVSFYDVETRVHLYSFTGCTFTERLYPFFSPHPIYYGGDNAPLIISPVNHTH